MTTKTTKATPVSVFTNNITALSLNYPDLANRIKTCPNLNRITLFQAQDGSLGYGFHSIDIGEVDESGNVPVLSYRLVSVVSADILPR